MSKELKNNAAFIKLISQFNLKKIVTGIGHEKRDIACNLCLKTKVILKYMSDCGENTQDFTSKENETYLTKFIKDNKLNQVLFDNGYHFMNSVERVSNETVIDEIVNTLFNLKQAEKHENTLKRHCEKSIVVGKSALDYSYYGYTKIKSLTEITDAKGGVASLQGVYDKAVKNLKQGEKVLNSDEQLLSLGLKLAKA